MKKIKATLLILLILITVNLFAQSKGLQSFNHNSANKQFDKISIELSTHNLSIKKLSQSVLSLSQLKLDADECVNTTEGKISAIESQIKKYFGDNKDNPQTIDSQYLEKQKQKLLKIQSECRLFSIRANEAITAYQKTILNLQQKQAFTRSEHLIKQFQELPSQLKSLKFPEIKLILDTQEIALLCTLLIFIIAIAIFAYTKIRKYIYTRIASNNSFAISFVLLLSLSLIGLSIYFIIPTPFIEPDDNSIYQQFLINSMLFTLSLFTYILFFSLRRVPVLFKLYDIDYNFVKYVTLSVVVIYFLRQIGLNIINFVEAPASAYQLFDNVILLISFIATLIFTYTFDSKYLKKAKNFFNRLPLFKSVTSIIIILFILNIIGYNLLVMKVSQFIFAVLFILFLGYIFCTINNKLYNVVNYDENYQIKLKKLFGYHNEPPFLEFVILRAVFHFLIVMMLCFLFAEVIGEMRYFIDNILNGLIHGFKVTGVLIKPLKLILGLVLFCFLILLSRYIANKISSKKQILEGEEETQVALASIVLYIGFSISILAALIFSGVNLTNIVILAGALSVGIGLGLQSIINNFFSGIILLIEKPVKVGDRINVSGIEGFVKKIRVRSTQIETPAKEDIIIPNSDLISQQVTNFMFNDKYWRVKCEVGVAYGSNTDLVKKLLLDIAEKHPEIVKTKKHKPLVLFRSFGDSALLFELWCMIRDVNKKYAVGSELNFMIDESFRENNITIAFPQRDIHVKIDDIKKIQSDNANS